VERFSEQPVESGETGMGLPDAGQSVLTDAHANVIYDAPMHDGCQNLPVFPVWFEGEVRNVFNLYDVLGEFSSVDDSTILPDGYWRYRYLMRIMDAEGAQSNVVVEGRVQALCSALESYVH
jgi:hypothetical protein